jgi:hypothetical protein
MRFRSRPDLGAPDAVVNLAASPPSGWAKILGCGVREQQVLATWVEPTYLHREVKDDVS